MKVYDIFSKIYPAKNKYAVKFFLIVLLGSIIPLLMLALFVVNSAGVTHAMHTAGLAATGISIVLLIACWRLCKQLVAPVALAHDSLVAYNTTKVLPNLPLNYHDEIGLLFKDMQEFLDNIDTQLTEKSDMIDLLSHDLRSPVARIMGLSNLIKLDENPENVEYAEYIYNECKNLNTLLENILLMFKGDTHAFEAQNVNLNSLITESVNFFKIAAADKDLTLKADINEDLVINVQAGLFTQAIRNIIGNAIKFSKEGKSIFITAKKKGQEVSITIRDEGVGMKHDELVKIFERFTKAGKKGTKGEASFGLGLYLSKKIIEKQGGKIVAESEGPNKGAIFVITLYQLITKKSGNKIKDVKSVK